MSASVIQADSGEEPLVPAEWPLDGIAQPVDGRRSLGPVVLACMPGLWILPRTLGPWMAAARLGHAVSAHLISFVFGAGLIVWALQYPWLNPAVARQDLEMGNYAPVSMTWWELVRGPPAALVMAVHEHVGIGGGGGLIGLFVGMEAALLVVAAATMSWGAAGGSSGALFGRSLRLTYWSTTLILPVGLAFLLEPQVRQMFGERRQWLPAHTIGLAVCGLWWLWLLLRSNLDCRAVSGRGMAQPHLPRCEGCGYTLAYLRLSTNCPECGRPVGESLPEARKEPAVARAQGFWPFLAGLFSTLRAALTDRSFFRTLAVYRGHERARSYVIALCGIDAVLILPGIPGAYSAIGGSTVESELWSGALAIAVAIFCGQVLLAGLLASGVSAVARRPLMPTSVAVFYGLSSLLPVTAIVLIGTVTVLVFGLVADTQGSRALLPGVSVLAAIATGTGLWVGFRAVRCFARAIKDTRFANA